MSSSVGLGVTVRRLVFRGQPDHHLALGEELVAGAGDRDDALVLLLELLAGAGSGRIEDLVERAEHRVHAAGRATHGVAEPSEHDGTSSRGPAPSTYAGWRAFTI